MNQQQLESILGEGDVKACLKFFAKLSEDQRQAVSKDVQTLARPILENPFIDLKDGGFKSNPRLPAAQVAALAACSIAQIKKLWRRRWLHFPEDDLVFSVFSARKPAWLDDWANWACARNIGHWSILRRLVRAGLCSKPDHAHYTLGMITGLCAFHENKATIYDALRDDADLLREDIWRLFEFEGDLSSSLAARDKYVKIAKNTWTYALTQLAKEKKLPRKQLLDASLDALARDFGTFQAGWFSRFHEALEPTLKERTERSPAYLSLLGSRVAPTVSFALKALLLLARSDLLEAKALLAAIAPALANRHKGTVQSALQLLDLVGKQNPGLNAQMGIVLADALLHTSPDVHKKAIDLLTRITTPIDPALAQVLRDRLDNVAASQRTRLRGLLESAPAAVVESGYAGKHELEEKELRKRAAALDPKWRRLAGVDRLLASLDSGQDDLAGIDFDPMQIPRLHPQTRISPIDTVEELIDVCSHVLENPDNTADLERVYDGISRLCADRPDDFDSRTGPLRKRARDHMNRMYAAPFFGCGPLIDLCGLVAAWLGSELLLAKKTGVYEYDKSVDIYQLKGSKQPITMHVSQKSSVANFQSERVLEIARRCIAGQAVPLLAAPTHQGGWIDPGTLVERAISRQGLAGNSDRLDQIQAFLRLAPDGRAPALKTAGRIKGEFGQALRHALGGKEVIGGDVPLWIAAARARNPFADDEKLCQACPGLGPNAAEAAVYQPKLQPIPNDPFQRKQLRLDMQPARPASVGRDSITVLLSPKKRVQGFWHDEYRKNAGELRGMLQIWPIQREAWFAAWAQPFADNLDWWEAEWGNRVFLEPLLDPDVPLDPMARLMLALGLAAKEPGESSLATDALIGTIDDARFDPGRFGESLSFLMPMLKAARLARTFAQAARVSPLHRHLLCRAVQATLRGNPEDAPRDLSALLEFLKEGLVEGDEAVTDAQARKYLTNLKAGGKTGRLVRELLGLESKPQPAQNKLHLQVLANRIQRAELRSSKHP
jgi:hypothetical protein